MPGYTVNPTKHTVLLWFGIIGEEYDKAYLSNIILLYTIM